MKAFEVGECHVEGGGDRDGRRGQHLANMPERFDEMGVQKWLVVVEQIDAFVQAMR